jgi:hypothetical protein
VLRRLLAWSQSLINLKQLTASLRDTARVRPIIPTSTVARGALVMTLCRLGSFNALEQSHASPFWRQWLGDDGQLPSADTFGRVSAGMDLGQIRQIQHELYTHLKRNKALSPPPHGLVLAVLDGHETHSTIRRCCPGCLQRVLRTRKGEVIQYYHRLVTMMLVAGDQEFLLDAEPILPSKDPTLTDEDEVAAATRLFDRVIVQYPRAFDVVGGDALYARGDFFNHVKDKGKDVIAVLKKNNPDLLSDATALCQGMPPKVLQHGGRQLETWDIPGFKGWATCRHDVRVVRSDETWSIRRQLDKQEHRQQSHWVWVTTLPQVRAGTAAVVVMGHERWSIENQGFNELVNRWHADHVYRHDGHAMLVLWLLTMISANLFAAFYRRNLKPAVRKACDTLQVTRMMIVDLYQELAASMASGP